MRRTKEDLWNAFFAQRAALIASIANFDAGMMFEASRIANTIFLLVGQGMRTHVSILDQLGIQCELLFHASNGERTTGSPLISFRLTKIRENSWIIETAPVTNPSEHKLKFDEWWSQRILCQSDGTELTRNELVRIIRDKDGGSHYDSKIADQKARALLDGNIGVYYESEGVRRIAQWGIQMMTRQVGEELRNSIKYLERTYDAPFHGYHFLEGSRFHVP